MIFLMALGGIINSTGLTVSSEFTHFLDGALFDDQLKVKDN